MKMPIRKIELSQLNDTGIFFRVGQDHFYEVDSFLELPHIGEEVLTTDGVLRGIVTRHITIRENGIYQESGLL